MEILQLILVYLVGLGPIVLAMLLLVGGGVASIWVGISRPQWLIFSYLSILVCFTGSGYGNLDDIRTIYSRGSGQLFFPFVVWGLAGMSLLTMVYLGFRGEKGISSNIRWPYLALLGLFFGNLAIAPMLGVSIKDALSNNGIINLIFIGFLFYILLSVLDRKKDLDMLLKGLLVLIAVMGLFGLGRLLFFGGDPANVYSNVEHLNVKLTFFDISDSMLACFGAVYALRRLLSEWGSLEGRTRLILTSFALLELAIIVLSYRRTAWAGLAVAALFVIAVLPPRQRWLPLLAAPFVAMATGMVAMQRLATTSGQAGVFETFFYDLSSKGHWAEESARTLELKFATATALEYPVFGVGIWGRYEAHGYIPWQFGKEAYAFVHSTPLHLLLKTGFVGTGLVCLALLLFARFVWSTRKSLPESHRIVLDASVAALLFMVPDFLIGTPVTQFRITQLYALFMAIPYLLAAASNLPTRGGFVARRPMPA